MAPDIMTDPWIEWLHRMERTAAALHLQAQIEDDPAGALHGCANAYADRLRRMSSAYGAAREEADSTSG